MRIFASLLKISSLVVVFGIFTAAPVHAGDSNGTLTTKPQSPHETGYVKSQALTQGTTDNVVHQEVQVEYHNCRRDFFWPYAGEGDRGWDFGLVSEIHSGRTPWGDYHGRKAMGQVGYKFSRSLYTSIAGGAHRLDDGTEVDAQTEPSYTWEGDAIIAKELDITARVNHDFVYGDWVSSGAVTDKVIGTIGWLGLDEWTKSGFHFASHTFKTVFSDNNSQQSQELIAMYGLSTSTPWIYAGLGASIMGFQFQTPDYWSPQNYTSVGPRFESSFPLFKNLTAAATLYVSEHREAENDPGYDYYSSAKLSYGQRGDLTVDLIYSRMGSLPGTGDWARDDIFLAASSPL